MESELDSLLIQAKVSEGADSETFIAAHLSLAKHYIELGAVEEAANICDKVLDEQYGVRNFYSVRTLELLEFAIETNLLACRYFVANDCLFQFAACAKCLMEDRIIQNQLFSFFVNSGLGLIIPAKEHALSFKKSLEAVDKVDIRNFAIYQLINSSLGLIEIEFANFQLASELVFNSYSSLKRQFESLEPGNEEYMFVLKIYTSILLNVSFALIKIDRLGDAKSFLETSNEMLLKQALPTSKLYFNFRETLESEIMLKENRLLEAGAKIANLLKSISHYSEQFAVGFFYTYLIAGDLESKKGNFILACEYYEKVFSLLTKYTHKLNFNLVDTSMKLSMTWFRLGNKEAASKYGREAVGLSRSIFGESSQKHIEASMNLANLISAYGFPEEGLEMMYIVQKRISESLSPDHSLLNAVKQNIQMIKDLIVKHSHEN